MDFETYQQIENLRKRKVKWVDIHEMYKNQFETITALSDAFRYASKKMRKRKCDNCGNIGELTRFRGDMLCRECMCKDEVSPLQDHRLLRAINPCSTATCGSAPRPVKTHMQSSIIGI